MLRSLLALLVVLALLPQAARAAVAPVLAVDSFTTGTGVAAAVGAQFADAIADEARDAGGVIVVRGSPNLTPAQFRGAARSLNADDYLIGSIAPVGTAYSVLIQLVSTRSGLLTWTTTVQVASAADLHGIGAQVRQLLLDQSGRGTFAAAGAVPAPSPAVAFAAPGAESTPFPPSTYAVMPFGGSALTLDRTLALRSVLDEIRKRGASAVADGVTGGDVESTGAQACMDTGAATIVGGTLDTVRADDPVTIVPAPAAPVTASITLQAYDCRTQTLLPKVLTADKSAPLSSDAVRAAAAAVVASYLTPASPAPKR
jgi:hypothetical protein